MTSDSQSESGGVVSSTAWLGGMSPGRLMHEECTGLDDFWDLLTDEEKTIWAEREERVRKPLLNLLAHWVGVARLRDPIIGRMDRERRFFELATITGKVVQPPNYERTDPDYLDKRIARMRAEYNSLPKEWKAQYLNGLSRIDREEVLQQ